jgi:dipeptidyl aminopeptidase/acylaminoacyl peptidase
MRYYLMLFAFLCCINCCICQKPCIDTNAYSRWPSVENAALSADGSWALYTIENQPENNNTLVVIATNNTWKIEIPRIGTSPAYFTGDCRNVVFEFGSQRMGIVQLGSSKIDTISAVNSFKLTQKGSGHWLAYQLSSPKNMLILQDLVSGRKDLFDSALDYKFDEAGNALIVKSRARQDAKGTQIVKWIDLNNSEVRDIWQGMNADNFVFDEAGTQLAFTTEREPGGHSINSICYYRIGMDKARTLADDHSRGIDVHLKIDNIQEFSNNGSCLFFSLKAQNMPEADPNSVRVNVWSYADSKLQSQQLKEIGILHTYTAILHIRDLRIIRLEYENEHCDKGRGGIALVDHENGNADVGESNWNTAGSHSVYLESLEDGKRVALKENVGHLLNFTLSPSGKYVLYYDPYKKNYFCYAVENHEVRNITKSISTNWTEFGDDHVDAAFSCDAIAAWLCNDSGVLLKDQHDIWQIDLSEHAPPINLTNGYGARHHIVFRLMSDYLAAEIDCQAKIILTAFDRESKKNGFFQIRVGSKGDPELLTMGPYLYDVPGNEEFLNGTNFTPIRAQNADAYIVRRMSAMESPNYLFTRDFKTLTSLSDLKPEKAYNWYTTELYEWKAPDGKKEQGILYKPENFDTKKKYPIIFYYYEKLSDWLNVYVKPSATDGTLNIPWYVSNGYLVFTPDFHYKIGNPMVSALTCLLSAVKHVTENRWVDSTRMGIQGHSFGGIETDYFVTHTHLFAAACSASGVADLISDYGGLLANGASLQSYSETGQLRMGTTLWQRPDLYIRNSAIFAADKVTTPLLMMHTKDDGVCPFSNAVELFTALRRLGKKVWMLQYDDCSHVLWGKSASDFSVRMQQFFDYYLKGARAPLWMTNGISAADKENISGLDLDTSGAVP